MDKSLSERFEEFHANNPEVYELFKRFAFEAIAAGRYKLAANMLIHRIRWESAITTITSDYKVNQNFGTFYGRLFARDYPQYRDHFSMRRSVADQVYSVAA